jgi:hypothetical protein
MDVFLRRFRDIVPNVNECFTYEEAEAALFKFEQLLKRWSITITPGSQLEAAAFSVVDLADRRRFPNSSSWRVDLRDDAANLVGVNDLAVHVLRAADHPDFERVVPHLRLLNEGQALQNRASRSVDGAANKLFELLVACWVMAARADDVSVDDPLRSAGNNPDVMFNWESQRWGIACKAIHSRAAQTVFERMQEGIRQVEASEASRGMVLVNVKNVIEHAKYMRPAAVYAEGNEPSYVCLSRSQPQEMLKAEIDGILAGLRDGIDPYEMIDAFLITKVVPAWILWGHTTSVVNYKGRPTLTSVPRLALGKLGEQPDGPLTPRANDLKLLERLNEAANVSPRPSD